tara:strand:- start:3655 stop:4089 length:435 start_codon:yes stop_codon:yes gene_type:complete
MKSSLIAIASAFGIGSATYVAARVAYNQSEKMFEKYPQYGSVRHAAAHLFHVHPTRNNFIVCVLGYDDYGLFTKHYSSIVYGFPVRDRPKVCATCNKIETHSAKRPKYCPMEKCHSPKVGEHAWATEESLSSMVQVSCYELADF